jgi:hypothetical protein
LPPISPAPAHLRNHELLSQQEFHESYADTQTFISLEAKTIIIVLMNPKRLGELEISILSDDDSNAPSSSYIWIGLFCLMGGFDGILG